MGGFFEALRALTLIGETVGGCCTLPVVLLLIFAVVYGRNAKNLEAWLGGAVANQNGPSVREDGKSPLSPDHVGERARNQVEDALLGAVPERLVDHLEALAAGVTYPLKHARVTRGELQSLADLELITETNWDAVQDGEDLRLVTGLTEKGQRYLAERRRILVDKRRREAKG